MELHSVEVLGSRKRGMCELTRSSKIITRKGYPRFGDEDSPVPGKSCSREGGRSAEEESVTLAEYQRKRRGRGAVD